jgi:peptidoglycan/LPS O-acetylase OafA/YrhL
MGTTGERARKDRAKSPAGYLAHVDGLRAIAILAVVAYHAWPTALSGGFVGVDVFFVVSGFLITRLVLAEMAAGTFSLPDFLARRARRLLPASTVVFVVVGLVSAVVLLPDAFEDFGRSLLMASLMLANVHFYRTAGYFSAPAHEKPLLHTWSLSVEDQFYLTWPLLLVLLAPRRGRGLLLIVALVLASASLVHAEATVGADPDYSFFILLPRAWELLAGCALAIAAPRIAMSRPVAELAAFAGLAAILASTLLLHAESGVPGLAALPAVAGTAAVILAGLSRESTVPRWLERSPLVLVGLVSYSLYLWHWPLLALAKYALARAPTPLEAGGIVALSFGLAWLSWRFVERPFRRHGAEARRTSTRVLLAGLGVMAVLAVTGGLVRILDGLPGRFGGPVGAMFSDMSSGNPLRIPCDGHERIFGTDAACNLGRRKASGESYDLAIIGDSNADHFVPMVAEWAERAGLAGRQVTQSRCAPLFGAARPDWSAARNATCAAFQRGIVRFVEANPGLSLVVLAGKWADNDRPLADNGIAAAGLAGPRAASVTIDSALRRTVAYLRDKGIRVVLVGEIPRFEVLPVSCVVAALQGGTDTAACGRARAEATRDASASDPLLRRVAAADAGVSVVSPVEVMCEAAHCPPMKDGVFLYRDPGHLSAAGSALLARYLPLPGWSERLPEGCHSRACSEHPSRH